MKVLIPDEYVPNYKLTKEEEDERYQKHLKKSDKAFKRLEKMGDKK